MTNKNKKSANPAAAVMYRRHKYDLSALVSGQGNVNAATSNEDPVANEAVETVDEEQLVSVIHQLVADQDTSDPGPAQAGGKAARRPAANNDGVTVPTAPVEEIHTYADMPTKAVAGVMTVPVGQRLSDEILPGRREARILKREAKKEARAKARQGRPALLIRIWRFLPKRSLIIIGAVAGLTMWQPLMLPAILVFVLSLMLLVYFSLGPDRVSHGIAATWGWLDKRRPAMAERIRARAQAIVLRLEAILHVIPGRWTEEIHLPDLSHPRQKAEHEAGQPDPFERLVASVRSE